MLCCAFPFTLPGVETLYTSSVQRFVFVLPLEDLVSPTTQEDEEEELRLVQLLLCMFPALAGIEHKGSPSVRMPAAQRTLKPKTRRKVFSHS